MNTDEFKKIAKQKYNNLYDYSNTKFVNFNTPVRIICKNTADHLMFYQWNI